MATVFKLGGFTHKPWKDAALRHWLGTSRPGQVHQGGSTVLPGGWAHLYPGYELKTNPGQILEMFPRGLQVRDLPGVETIRPGKDS